MTGGDMRGPEFDLIAQSAQTATARLRFFRLCYGASDRDRISATEIRSALAGFSPEGRVTVDWRPDSELSRVQARMICLGLQCLETGLAGTGMISVTLSVSGTDMIAQGTNLRLHRGLWAYIDAAFGVGAEISPKQVQFLLLGKLLQQTGVRATVSDDSGAQRITLRFGPLA